MYLARLSQLLTRHGKKLAAALLILYGLMAWSSVREKSNTFDESAHLTAGYSYWATGDYRLNPENGILPQRWAALPLLGMELRFPDTNDVPWQQSDVWTLGRQFFFQADNNFDAMLWWSRGMIVLLGIALGAVVYTWSRRLYGPVGGLISLVACVFCPSILAHGRLVTSDMAATLFFVAALGCFWMVLHRVSVAGLLVSGLVMGGLFVSKMSAVLMVPVALFLVAMRLASGRPLILTFRHRTVICDRPRQAAILAGVMALQAIIVVAIIWAFFGFHYKTFRESEPGRDQMYFGATIDTLTDDGVLGTAVRLANDGHLLPEPYLHGFAHVVARSQARVAFLNGQISSTGWRSFFPYSLMVKTPLPTLALLLVAALAVAVRWTSRRDATQPLSATMWPRVGRSLYRTAPLWVFFLLYWFLAIRSHMNIGHRHILPTYPMMFIFCGAAGYWIRGNYRVVGGAVLVALALLVVESVGIYPHYLAYFNQLIGGPRQAYRHLVDSSLDWGQDLPALKRWLAERDAGTMQDKPVYLSYFGTASPEYYNLEVARLPGYVHWRTTGVVPLEAGTYCVSASMLPSLFLDARGEWNVLYEVQYQRVHKEVDRLHQLVQQDPQYYERLQMEVDRLKQSVYEDRRHHEEIVGNSPRSRELAAWNRTLNQFDQLRMARLCAYLRKREPDDSVGYSILIYYLNEDDLDRALNQPIELKSN